MYLTNAAKNRLIQGYHNTKLLGPVQQKQHFPEVDELIYNNYLEIKTKNNQQQFNLTKKGVNKARQLIQTSSAGIDLYSTMYFYTEQTYMPVSGYAFLTNPIINDNTEMIQELIRTGQTIGAKYHANRLVHYLFVPGRTNSKEEQTLLKTHIPFYGVHDCYGLDGFYKSISRRFNKPSKKFLTQNIVNIAQPINDPSD